MGSRVVMGDQLLIKQVAVVGVQPQHRLIENDHRRVGGQGQDQLEDRQVTGRKPADLFTRLQLETLGQGAGVTQVELRVKAAGELEHLPHPHLSSEYSVFSVI